MGRGMLITFEGLDCSGKTTQAKLLVERLERERQSQKETFAVIFLREPGATKLSERIRTMLLDTRNDRMSHVTELFLFSAARAQLVSEVIKPALQKGDVVVCDRFYDSTTAYQGWGRGIDLDGVRKLNAIATSGLAPDLTFYLDIDAQEVKRRKSLKRNEGQGESDEDRMESSGEEFYNRVRKGYLELSRTEAPRFVVLDGKEPIGILKEKIWSVVRKRLRVLNNKNTGGSQ